MKLEKEKIILDDQDKHLLKKYHWYLSEGYALAMIDGKKTRMHHLILPKKKGFEIDHINRNRSDNRRCNLRYVTSSQNTMNSSKRSDNTSGYRGVWWDKEKKKWRVEIMMNRKKIYIGTFVDIEDAAKAYKNKAIELFQEYLGEV
jgi:hypothetical protein